MEKRKNEETKEKEVLAALLKHKKEVLFGKSFVLEK